MLRCSVVAIAIIAIIAFAEMTTPVEGSNVLALLQLERAQRAARERARQQQQQNHAATNVPSVHRQPPTPQQPAPGHPHVNQNSAASASDENKWAKYYMYEDGPFPGI